MSSMVDMSKSEVFNASEFLIDVRYFINES